MGKPYTMKAAVVPKRGGRVATSIYRDALDEFLAHGAKSVMLSFEGRKQATVMLQMRKVVKTSGTPVTVVQRAGDVYLIKP